MDAIEAGNTHKKLLLGPVGALCKFCQSSFQLAQGRESLPKTVSLVPAKSTVLMPRVCWNWVETAALGAAVREAALMAETKVRFWTGATANCLAALRRARGACLEAIVNVRRLCEGILMGEVWGIIESLWETSGCVESIFCPSSSRHRAWS